MGILGSLFGNDNHISKMIDGVSRGVDKAFFTGEEKVDAHMKFLKLYEPFKVAQRIIAMTFCIPYVLAWFITFIASFFLEVETQVQMLHGEVAQVVGIIAGFYFGGGAIEGIVGKFTKREKDA